MGIYSDHLQHEVRLERMRPEQIEAAKAQRPAIYVACGSVEWHGYHNPVGLDTLKAHEQLVGLADRLGGLVYPPIFLGAGGGHTRWPSSFMVSAEPMIRIVADLLHGFERDGYRKAILLSGHYPNQREYMLPAVTLYRNEGGTMDILSLIENQAPGVAGDHAAKYETSFMLYLCPELVDLERLRAGRQDDIAGLGSSGELDGRGIRRASLLRPGRHRPTGVRLGAGGAGKHGAACWRIWPHGWMRERNGGA